MKILLAIESAKCADAAVDAVISQIRPEQAEVLVLHVVDWDYVAGNPFPKIGEEPMYTAPQLESIIAAENVHAHDLVTHAAARLRAAQFQASTAVREGDAKSAILECATEWDPDLIVCGSHGRHGVARLFLGSVSEAVAQHAHCPVQIIRLAERATKAK